MLRFKLARGPFVSSADDPASFWLRVVDPQPRRHCFDAHLSVSDYRRVIRTLQRRHQPAREGGEGGHDWFSLIPPKRRLRIQSLRPRTVAADGPFGVAPVVLVISYTGGDWRMMTQHLGREDAVTTADMYSRVAKQSIPLVAESMASMDSSMRCTLTGFPGWEQVTYQLINLNLSTCQLIDELINMSKRSRAPSWARWSC